MNLSRIEQILLRALISFVAFELAALAAELLTLGSVTALSWGVVWVGVAGAASFGAEKWLTTSGPGVLTELSGAVDQLMPGSAVLSAVTPAAQPPAPVVVNVHPFATESAPGAPAAVAIEVGPEPAVPEIPTPPAVP